MDEEQALDAETRGKKTGRRRHDRGGRDVDVSTQAIWS